MNNFFTTTQDDEKSLEIFDGDQSPASVPQLQTQASSASLPMKKENSNTSLYGEPIKSDTKFCKFDSNTRDDDSDDEDHFTRWSDHVLKGDDL